MFRRRADWAPPATLALVMLSLVDLDGTANAGLRPQSTLIVISMDGFRFDYPQRISTPNFDRLAREGAMAAKLQPPMPSLTFPSHATLATGVSPAKHGIISNHFMDPHRGEFHKNDEAYWYDAVPLWIHATQHGLRTYVYHWIGSAGGFRRMRPAFWRYFHGKVRDSMKLEAIIDWIHLPPSRRPRLIMSYWHGCDYVGHEYGPMARQTTACIQRMDRLVGRLLEGVGRSGNPVTLVLVSDHGMMKPRGVIDIRRALRQAGLPSKVIYSGPVAHVYVADAARRRRVRRALKAVKGIRVYSRRRLPGGFHPTRTGQLVAVARNGYYFGRSKKAGVSPTHLAGHHGHDPRQVAAMNGIFYAWGAGIRAGVLLRRARARDVFPTACAILQIPVAGGVQGRVLRRILR